MLEAADEGPVDVGDTVVAVTLSLLPSREEPSETLRSWPENVELRVTKSLCSSGCAERGKAEDIVRRQAEVDATVARIRARGDVVVLGRQGDDFDMSV